MEDNRPLAPTQISYEETMGIIGELYISHQKEIRLLQRQMVNLQQQLKAVSDERDKLKKALDGTA